MAVAFDATSSSNLTDAVSSKSWSHTASGTNRCVVVKVHWNEPGSEITPVVTYGGVSMTQVGATARGNTAASLSDRCVALFILNNPVDTAATIVVNMGVACSFAAHAESFTGVHPTTPNGSLVSQVGTANTSRAAAITGGTAGDFVVSAACVRISTALTVPATSRFNALIGTNNRYGGASTLMTGATLTHTYSWTGSNTAAVAGFRLIQAPAGVTTKTQTAKAAIQKTATKTQTATARIGAPPAKMQTLIDDFSDDTQNAGTGNWQPPAGPGALDPDIYVGGGRFNSVAKGDYSGQAESRFAFDLTNSYAHVEVVQVIAQIGNGPEQYFCVRIDEDNAFYSILTGTGGIVWEHAEGGVTIDSGFTTYDQSTMRWLRYINTAPGVVKLQYAATNAGPWTDLDSFNSVTMDLSQMKVFFQTGDYSGGVTGGTAIWDNLNVPFGTITTKTQSATARIATTRTATQPATARIQRSLTKTQPASARVSATRTATRTATARITNTRTRTQTATARVRRNLTRTQGAIARIARNLTRTQTATSRISATRTATQQARARLSQTFTKNQSATARIEQATTGSKTQTATARISQTFTKTQVSTARISRVLASTQQARARIATVRLRTQVATARLQATRTATRQAIARISNARTATQGATAYIIQTPSKTQPATARIANTRSQSQSATARVANTITRTQTATARIQRHLTRTQEALARIANLRTRAQQATARIVAPGVKTQPATSRIATNETAEQSATGRISNTFIETQPATGRIENDRATSQQARARIEVQRTRSQPATARVAHTLTSEQSATARIANGRQRTQTATAEIANTKAATQTATSQISVTLTESQGATARVAITRAATQSARARIIIATLGGDWEHGHQAVNTWADSTSEVAGFTTETEEANGWSVELVEVTFDDDAEPGTIWTTEVDNP